MTLRTARWIAWAIVVLYFILAAAGLTLQGLAHTAYAQTGLPVLIFMMILVGVWTVTGARIISRHPQHPVGWLLCASLITAAIDMFAAGYASYDTYVFSGSLPGVDLALLWLKLVVLGPHGVAAFTLIILLFPDGRFPSPGWRMVAWTIVGALLLFLPLQAVEPGIVDPLFLPDRTNPLGISASTWAFLKPLMWTTFSILVLCYGAAFVSLIVRLRNSHGDVRQQIKWLLFPAGLFGIYLLLFIIGMAKANDAIVVTSIALGQLAIAGIVIAVAFAIFRYRLYDIDIIINRTLVYGVLTASVVGLYILVVGALGAFFQTQSNLIIALLATGLVAVLFQPLRERLQRGVNRLIYGERDDPIEALARLSRRLESALTPDEVLPDLVETIAQTFKLPYVAILLPGERGVRIAAVHGQASSEGATFPLTYQGRGIGQLVVGPRDANGSFSPSELRLLRTIARQAGAAVHTVQLTDDLQRSRAHLVTAREEERRRLRRDLHDGLGPVLASQGLKIAAVSHLLDSNPDSARKLLRELASQNELTVAEIRRLVYALRPPELDKLGLVGAIRDYAAGLDGNLTNGKGPEIEVGSPGVKLSGLPAAVEVAAYRIAMEALTNVTRHAQAHHCQVSFCLDENSAGKILSLEISDDGIGIPSDRNAGVGMNSMRERAEEVRGELQIESTPLKGTTVMARLPIAE